MKYTVVWSRRALSALTETWLARPGEREDVSRASDRIDQMLSVNPLEQGGSRDAGRRVLFVPPLMGVFRVDEIAHAVRVLEIRGLRSRGGG